MPDLNPRSSAQPRVGQIPQPDHEAGPRRSGYYDSTTIIEAFGFNPAELQDMAFGEPPMIHTIASRGQQLFSWDDARWVASVTTLIAYEEVDLL